MTLRLFLEDTTLGQCKAQVTHKGTNQFGHWVTLDQTIFHPQGGGQPSDQGTINGLAVVGLFEEGHHGEIYHFISAMDAEKLAVGQTVNLEIDMKNRLHLAALHTAGHALAAVVEEKYPLHTTKAHQYPGECSYEFKPNASSDNPPQLPDKEQMQNEIAAYVRNELKKKQPVVIHFDQKQERTIQIGAYPQAPCGGTHLANTKLIDPDAFMVRYVRLKKGVYKIGYDAAIYPDEKLLKEYPHQIMRQGI